MLGIVSTVRPAAHRGVSLGQKSTFTPDDLFAELSNLTRLRAGRMIDAARELTWEITRLAQARHSVVHEVLGSQSVVQPWVQYPERAAEDPGTGASFFFHSHGPSPSHPEEIGHFHVFGHGGRAKQSHLVAIAIDALGMPVRLFTTNRWVTGEFWTSGAGLLALADKWPLTAQSSSAALTRWIASCIQLFRPQLKWSVHRRDARLLALTANRRRAAVFEDRHIEVLSESRISIGQQISALTAALER